MIVKHKVRSGNECVVHVPDKVNAEDLTGNVEEWRRYPSPEDLKEFNDIVMPQKVRAVYKAIVRKALGPGRFIAVMPDLRVWLPAGTDLSQFIDAAKRNQKTGNLAWGGMALAWSRKRHVGRRASAKGNTSELGDQRQSNGKRNPNGV